MRPSTRSLPIALMLVLAAAPSRAQQDISFQPVFDAFLRGEFSARLMPAIPKDTRGRVVDVRSVLARDAGLWVAAGPAAERDRRRLLAGAVALYLANSVAASSWQRGSELLEWGCALVRRNSTPTEAERLWHWAGIALTQASGHGDAAEHHANHASDRFPDEPRFALARAVALEIRSFPDERHRTPRDRDAALAGRIHERLRTAARYPATRAEANIRLGFFMLRSGYADAALERFRMAEEVKEPYLQYLLWLFEGRAHEREQQFDEAIAAYRRAMAAAPGAQTAELALASLLARQGRQAEALPIVQASLTPVATPTPPDPWLSYGQGDIRFWPLIAEALEAALR